MKNFTAIIILLLALSIGCKKDSHQLPEEQTSSIDRDSLFLLWGQAANGRWVAYSMEKIDKNRLKKENSMALLNASVEPIYYARKHYQSLLSAKYGAGITDFGVFLDSLYQVNYATINSTLKKRSVMDGLFKDYERLMPSRKASKIMSSNKSAFWDIPAVVIQACRIPANLVNFFNIYLAWPPYMAPHGSDEIVRGCRAERLDEIASAMAMLRFEYTRVQNSITGEPGFCDYWANEA